jgi:hypothetical protein
MNQNKIKIYPINTDDFEVELTTLRSLIEVITQFNGRWNSENKRWILPSEIRDSFVKIVTESNLAVCEEHGALQDITNDLLKKRKIDTTNSLNNDNNPYKRLNLDEPSKKVLVRLRKSLDDSLVHAKLYGYDPFAFKLLHTIPGKQFDVKIKEWTFEVEHEENVRNELMKQQHITII